MLSRTWFLVGHLSTSVHIVGISRRFKIARTASFPAAAYHRGFVWIPSFGGCHARGGTFYQSYAPTSNFGLFIAS